MIEGFETGILSQWIWGQTLSRITIRNCRSNGVVVCANAVGIEDLTVENTPVAIRNEVPNNWGHWGGVIALVGGRFTGGSPEHAAILNRSVLYARDVKTSGYRMALESTTPGGNVSGSVIEEYVSNGAKHLFDAPSESLKLPIKPEPEFPWETDPAKWVCANDFGAVPGDNQDDTEAIQKAIDAAAASGKTTVFLRGVSGGDPNWYTLNGEVKVHGSVRHILALGFGRILGNKGAGKFVITDDSAPVVKFQHLQAFGGGPPVVENRSASCALVVESCDMQVLGTGRGDIFVTDCSCHVDLRQAGQKCWARQLNPEGTSDAGLVLNAGADLWVLGAKFEGAGVRFHTSNGGQTEVLGMFLYDPGDLKEDDQRPVFDVDNASFSIAGLREITFGKHTYTSKVREKRGGETRVLDKKTEGGWIGWPLFRSGKDAGDRTPRK